MAKHAWSIDDDGYVDVWVLSKDYHNGPFCEVCLEAFCMHCFPGCFDEECPGWDTEE